MWLEETPSIGASVNDFIWGRLHWVLHTYNPSPGETEAGDSIVPSHPGIHHMILSQAKKIIKA